MTIRETLSSNRRLLAVIAIGVFAAGAVWYVRSHSSGIAPLSLALTPLLESENPALSRAANVLLVAFKETRSTAANWSGVFWGSTFLSAALSATAAFLLKFDSWSNDKRKKDVAALLSVAATLLVTISTLGDFQRKWNANRMAAAELELIAYELVGQRDPDGYKALREIGRVQHERNASILGQSAKQRPPE